VRERKLRNVYLDTWNALILVGSIKDRNGMDLTETENIKKR